MAQDKRATLYQNLIRSGKVSSREIGTLDQFVNALKDESSSRHFYQNLIGSGRLSSRELGSEDDFFGSISSDFVSPAAPSTSAGSSGGQTAGRSVGGQQSVPATPRSLNDFTRYSVASILQQQSQAPQQGQQRRDITSQLSPQVQQGMQQMEQEATWANLSPQARRVVLGDEGAQQFERYQARRQKYVQQHPEIFEAEIPGISADGLLPSRQLADMTDEQIEAEVARRNAMSDSEREQWRRIGVNIEDVTVDELKRRRADAQSAHANPIAYLRRQSDQSKATYEERKRRSIDGQIAAAQQELERAQQELEAQRKRDEESRRNAEKGLIDENYDQSLMLGDSPSLVGAMVNNSRYDTQLATIRNIEDRIRTLEAERDDAGQSMFWRGFTDAITNPSTWSFGVSDLQTSAELLRVKGKLDRGEQLTYDEQRLLETTVDKNQAEHSYGGNRGFMYRAGNISAEALPFAAEFILTDGMGNISSIGAKAGSKAAEKWATNAVTKWLMKNTGVLAGDAAAAFVMANTTGAGRTASDVMNRHMGQVVEDGAGGYQFVGGKSLGRSIYEAEVANTIEYYTEKLGSHLELGKWMAKGAEKAGLSRLSKAVNYLSDSRWLERAGIHDYPSEVMEEEANIVLNSLLVGDQSLRDLVDGRTQADIWGGMMFSIGLMQTPRVIGLAHSGYQSAQYYRYRHGVNVSDSNAEAVMGADRWQPLKESIDGASNEEIADIVTQILADESLNDEGKRAAIEYTGNLVKMRGYNMGTMANAKEQALDESGKPDYSNTIDHGYSEGHEAQEPDVKKRMADEAQAAEARLGELFDDASVFTADDTDPMQIIDHMLANRGSWYTDEQISAVMDYYQKQARAQGMMDAAIDDVELQVAKANAEVRSNTHKGRGDMVEVSSGDDSFFVVGGELGIIQDPSTGDMTFDTEVTGDALVVRDVETGEISVKSPQQLHVVSISDPQVSIQENETTLRQQLMQQHQDDITFGSPANEVFQLNDMVVLNDGQGNVVEGEIGMMPNSVDGVYVVYTNDGQAMQYTEEQLNRMIVQHNGVDVERASIQNTATESQSTVADTVMSAQPIDESRQQTGGEATGTADATSVNVPGTVENEGGIDNAGGEAGREQTGADNPSASALSRIPVVSDGTGKPILNRKGNKQYQWHKASVDDTTDAMIELTGGDMLSARDTATQMIDVARGELEKARKQKAKGSDPIEIAESRAANKAAESEAQQKVQHWQKVNQAIQQRMRDESARRQAEIEAAKSAEQKSREAEEKRQQQERLDEIDRERLREAIEKEQKRRNRPYEPLVQARKQLANDSDAVAILDDTEPRDLREWVSSLLMPHSILWQDASDSEIGLKSELGLQRADMQRFMTLLGTKENGAKPFGKVVLDIHEGLSDAMKEMYTDQDVRNVILELFNESSNSRQMMNLVAENRMEEARQLHEKTLEREAQYEMEAWAESHHLSPDEREEFEEFLASGVDAVDEATQEALSEAFADDDFFRMMDEAQEYYYNNEYNEQNTGSTGMDSQHPDESAGGENQGGEVQVQRTGTSETVAADSAKQGQQGTETDTGSPAVPDNNVPGGASVADVDPQRVFLDQQSGESTQPTRRDASDMSDEELLEAIGRQGYDINKALDVDVYDEYDSRHRDEYDDAYKMYYDSLSGETIDNVEQMLAAAEAEWRSGGYASDNRARLNAQIDVLREAYDALEAAEQTQSALESWGDEYHLTPEERETINQTFVNNEQNRTSQPVGQQPASRAEGAETGRGQGEVQGRQASEVAGVRNSGERKDAGAETGADRRAAADEPAPGPELEDDSLFPPKKVDTKRLATLKHDLSAAYASGDRAAIEAAAADIRQYIAEGYDWDGYYRENIDDYTGNDPDILVEQYATHALMDRHLDDDEDQEYIRTGLRADLREAMQQPIGPTSTAEEIGAEEGKVNTEPTDGQKEAGNYQKGHIKIDGFDVTIENPKGSVRRGTDANGQQWETVMHNTYGYIRRTEGVDGDHIDIFLSDNPTGGQVFVVDQVNPGTGEFDEHKVMYGFSSEEEAREAYLSNYSEGWQGLGAITEVSREDFKKWVQSSHRKTKPFAEYKSVKKREASGKARGASTGNRKADAALAAQTKDERPGETAGKVAEHKRLVSDSRMEELKERLRKKLGGQLNVGIDPEVLAIGAELAIGHIERGVTKFADYAKAMIGEVGDFIRPYLKAFYNAVRDMPEAAEYADQMDDYQTVSQFDVHNFDKQQVPPVLERAKQVSDEQKVQRQAKKIKKEQPDLFAGSLFGEEETAAKPAEKAADTAAKPGRNRPDTVAKPKLDKKDYRTYMTPEAREYFANDPRFAEFPHPELAFVTAAVWDGVVIPVEELAKIPAIVEAEKRVKAKEDMPPFTITAEDIEQHAQHLLDAEHGSAVFENGKIRKVDGHEDFTGAVKQERKAFVVIGRPAGGKSSVFANSLSNKHGARIIDSDTVKEWFDEFDNGYGAGYVQLMSSEVAERALDIAAQNGDNIILPRIGGNSVLVMSAALRMSGYDVQLYYNDVVPDTSYMRSQSRFAMTGRYLSLDYLTSIKDKPSKIFSKFAEKSLGDYIHECTEEQIQKLRGRLERLVGGQRSDLQRALSWSLDEERRGVSDGSVSGNVERSESDGDAARIGLEAPIFSYAEWKSNDVSFGEKPKEIWNSKSGEPMPGSIKDNNNDNTQRTDESGPSGLQANGIRPEAGNQGRSEETGKAAGQESKRADGGREGGSLRQSANQGLGHSIETTQGVTDGGEARGSSEGPSRTSKDGVTRGAVSTDTHKNRRNNVGERGKDYAPLSPKARFNANVQAIKIMRLLVDEGVEVPTKDQMEALRQYSGWGGMGTFFNDENSAENKILRDLLSEEEYNDAALSIKTAYYTPATVIDTLWDLAKAAGFKGGNVLEGSAGIGNIIGQMPKEMSRRSDIEAVELDSISGNILKLLYPDAKVHIQGFQDTVIPNGTVDLAITNVPFAADISVIDKVDKDLSRQFRQLHDFCIAKNIRKLKEGGIGIFITTSGTLDKSTKLREWIPDAGQTDVIGAFRLHNKTFGGTNVTSDIIVVRKRVNGQKSPNAIDISKATPLRVGTYEDKYHDEHQASMVVNDYFKDHPEMMAGEMFFGYEKGDTYRPGSYGLYPVEGKDQDKMLADFTKGIKEEETVQPQTEQEPVKNQLTAEKEGRMLIDGNGRLCVSERGVAVPLAINATKVKGQTKEQCFKDYQEVQKAVDEVLQQQLSDPDDAALKPKLDALNKAFDKFVKRYGYLHKNTSISFLRNDIDFPSFQALEIYKESKDIHGKVTVKTEKPKLFTQRVLGFKTEPQPKNIKDAVTASIFRSNSIDVPWIAERLGKSEEDVRYEILESRLGFEDPSSGQLEVRYKYLSGNVREKLAIAEAYNTPAGEASDTTAGRYTANVEELRKVVPMDIPAHLIDFSLGSSWIPVEVYKEYLSEVYDLRDVKLMHLEGSWSLDPQYHYHNEKNRSAGVYSEQFKETIYGHELVAAALNNRPVKVAKQVTEGYGSSKTTRTVVDKSATQACSVRVDEIKDEFKAWAKKKMRDDADLAARIEKLYNDKFNALVPMTVGDEFLPEVFEGANTSLPLYGHQKRGVIRGVTAPTMLAHEVGTGKSFTLITTAMEMKRLGTAKKPMIVVQNATVAQMTADAKLLYPNARVLSLSERDRNAEGRRAFYAKIRYNDWDIIIVPQSTFERIPDSPERELQFIQEKIDEKKHVIEAAEAAGADSRELQRLKKELEGLEEEYGDKFLDSGDNIATDRTGRQDKKKDAKREATALENAEVRAREQLDRQVDDVQYFDDLGVDAILVDEAHEYKHLGFQTSIGRGIKGIDPSYSKKCAGLYNKTRSVFERAGWKNVVFATGTPISNTAAEIWTFMKYLMPADVMRQNDIYYFDDFVHNFGSITQMLEFATSGKFKENTRFAAYVNKPELIRIWSQVADTVLTKEVGAVNEKIPEIEGGKDQDVFLPQSPSLISIMAAVRAELERFENMSGKEKKENSSIPLTMYGIAKRAAIDPRLVNPDAPDEPLSKTNAAVKEIAKDLEATKDYKGTVAVFCDNQNRLGANKTVEFNIYEDMRDKLIALGVPAEQIAIIKSGMSITAKQKVFDAVNSGDIRVVLGSTQTLGTGVNMQERLHLLIHIDAPDRPMDYTQRNGRIKRQGNLHKTWGKTIRVLRFGVEDSLDVTAYQRLKTKSGFIDSIMDGKGALLNNQVDRTVEEEEEGLFDNPVAVLSGSQYALKKNQAERELRKYQSKRAQWEADQVYVSNTLRWNKNELEAIKGNIAEEEKQLTRIRSLFPGGTATTITVEGVKIDMRDGDAALGKLTKTVKEKINDPVNATVKKLRENQIYNDEVLDFTIELDGHKVNFRVSVEREAVYENGKVRTVVHKYTTYDSPSLGIDALMKSSKSVGDHLNDILDEVVSGRDNTDRIEAYKAKIERINSENEQLQQRVGMTFQFDKELEEARKHVEEYTELMKQEMKEKEAKYAAQQPAGDAAGTFDLHKAEDSEDDDDSIRYSADEDSHVYHIIRVLDALENEHPGFNDAFSVDAEEDSGVNELWISNREAALQLYKNKHPDAEGDYYFSMLMWARQLFDDKLKDPSLQSSANELPDFAKEAETVRDDTIVTDNFKGFFGDWEKSPESASKVVDKDGKPQIMYHATNLTRVNGGQPFWEFYPDSHFGTIGQSKHIANGDMYGDKKTYPVYLNIRNPKRVNDTPSDWEGTHSEWWEKQVRRAKEQGYDGLVYLNKYEDREHPADSWVVAFEPTQIKLAVDNSTFDPTNPDIRLRAQEQFREGETFPIHRSVRYGNDVLASRGYVTTDLMPDEYATVQSLLDAVRNQYPDYYVSVENGQLRFESWQSVMHGGQTAMSERKRKGAESYAKRKTQRAIDAVTRLASKLHLDVEVLTSTDGLEGKKARSKGWFNPKTGKITIILPNHRTVSDVINTVLHEGVAHYGLRQLFGDRFGTFLDNVYNNVSPDIRRIIDASIKRNGWSKHEATEEYLARLAERTDFEHATRQGWWQKIKSFFVDMLRKMGIPMKLDMELTDNELRYALWRSYENLRSPGRYRSLFDTAKDTAMQSKLKVGRYAKERIRLQKTGKTDTSPLIAAEQEAEEYSDANLLHSIRTKEPPKKTGIGYKVFVLKNGQLYPPMVANPDGEGTPIGVWIDADAAPIAGTSKTGRPQVKAGGKGTQGGSGQLAYRPGWHLGTIPYALQFNRKDAQGERTLFPNNFVWAEVEYADDIDYQDEARKEGINANGKYQHSLAGLKHIPTDGSYKYRTNPDPRTDEWVITGAMRVNRILTRQEVDDMVREAGREPQPIQDGDILTDDVVKALNDEIGAVRAADDMGLLYRDDDAWLDESYDVARQMYEEQAASRALKWQEAWQDSMAGLKVLQNAIERETGAKATGAEDAYAYENRMHGKAKNQSEIFDRVYYRPILKAIDKLMKAKSSSVDVMMQYLVAKHGLERNIYYAFKEAVEGRVQYTINKERRKLKKQYDDGKIDAKEYKKQEKALDERLSRDVQAYIEQVMNSQEHQDNKVAYEQGTIPYSVYIAREEELRRQYVADYDDHKRDFSGLTELTGEEDAYGDAAAEFVDDMESGGDDITTYRTNLWNCINAATKETLKTSYESGMMSRAQYNQVRTMFDYYVPLRGWAEDNADDAYDYVTKRNVFSTAVKKTWGRKSVAESPIAYIGNMAVSTILAGHRNQMKQHFLNYVLNNKTSLVSISEQWWENKGTATNPYWVEVRPEIPADATADEIAAIVEAFNEDMKQKQEQGMAMNQKGKLHIDYHATVSEKSEHAVEVQRNGKTYVLYINGNPKAAQALNGANSRSVARITDVPGLDWIPKVNRLMAANFTSRNPAFIISNMSRDLNMAGASVAVKEGSAYNARFVKNVAKVLSPRIGKSAKWIPARRQPTGLMPSLMRKWLAGELNTSDETERYFKEFMDEGGETGFVNMLSVDSFKEKMVKELGRMNGATWNPLRRTGGHGGTKEMYITKGLRLMGDIFEFYNRCAEDSTRFIVYMTSRQMSKSLEESIADAKDVTLNFNRKGTGGLGNGVIRDLFIFTNPAIQALANMYKMAYKHPLKLGVVTAAFFAGGALMPILNQWLLQLFGDDDDKEAYWNLPPWVRKNNLVMWVPGTKNFVTIPLAQEFRVFYGMGEMTSSLIYEHPVHNWPMEICSSFMDLLPINPTGNAGKLSIDLSPTVFQPLMQIDENTDFTGRPIWRENQGNKWAPMYTKAYASTPEWMVGLAEGVNSLGGNEGKKGWIESNAPFWGNYINNPAVWNHLLQGYFGGMYNTVSKSFDVGFTLGHGETPKVYQTPIINRFLNRPVERDNGGVLGEDYYSLIEERDRTQYEVRTWRHKAEQGDADAQRYLNELMQSERYRRMEVITHYENIMKDLRAGERAIREGAEHADADLWNIHDSMDMYKVELLDELAAISDGKDPLQAAVEKFNSATSWNERNRLRLRIERLTAERGSSAGRTAHTVNSDVDKALAYMRGEEIESRNTQEQYLALATGADIVADARIRAAKARIKVYTDEFNRLRDEGRTADAQAYRSRHLKWFQADAVIKSQQRGIATNKKLLGRGRDEAIMRLIGAQRDRMLRAIEGLE